VSGTGRPIKSMTRAPFNDEASVEDEALTNLEDAEVQASLRTGILVGTPSRQFDRPPQHSEPL
jgi:hypothetical protein